MPLINDCGGSKIEWKQENGSELPSAFQIVASAGGLQSLVVATHNGAQAGEYLIRYKYYKDQKPGVAVYSNTFRVVVVNHCMPPPECESSASCGYLTTPEIVAPVVEIPITYTTGMFQNIDLPMFECDSGMCQDYIQTSLVDDSTVCCENCDCNQGGLSVKLMSAYKIRFYAENCDNLCDDHTGSEFRFTFQGTLQEKTVTYVIVITVRSACFDESLIQILPVDLPKIEYTLYEEFSLTHDSFVGLGADYVKEQCGDLALNYAISHNIPEGVTYADNTISIYSEDMSLLVSPEFTYTIEVSLMSNPEIKVTGSNIITLKNPCEDPFNSFASVVPNVNFDFGVDATEFTFPASLFRNPICQQFVSFTCTYVQGPVSTDVPMCGPLSQAGDMVTDISFDTKTGKYSFFSEDRNTYEIGLYAFTITATLDTESMYFPFTMSVF
jgi:hypothetical protein